MTEDSSDAAIRTAAFEHVRQLDETHDHLTSADSQPEFTWRGECIPLVNPQRGIFKPRQRRFLLSLWSYRWLHSH